VAVVLERDCADKKARRHGRKCEFDRKISLVVRVKAEFLRKRSEWVTREVRALVSVVTCCLSEGIGVIVSKMNRVSSYRSFNFYLIS
jgi:hypothetical protein